MALVGGSRVIYAVSRLSDGHLLNPLQNNEIVLKKLWKMYLEDKPPPWASTTGV